MYIMYYIYLFILDSNDKIIEISIIQQPLALDTLAIS